MAPGDPAPGDPAQGDPVAQGDPIPSDPAQDPAQPGPAEVVGTPPTGTGGSPSTPAGTGGSAVVAPKVGTVRLAIQVSTPAAEVFVDGKSVGRGDTFLVEVEPGQHKVRAQATDYEPQEQVLALTASPEPVEVMLVLRRRGGSTAQGGSSARTDPPKTDPPKTDPPKTTPPATSSGAAKLFGPAGAQVFLNGKLVGVLPATIPLTAGTHSFRVITADGVTYEKSATVVFDATGTAKVPLNL